MSEFAIFHFFYATSKWKKSHIRSFPGRHEVFPDKRAVQRPCLRHVGTFWRNRIEFWGARSPESDFNKSVRKKILYESRNGISWGFVKKKSASLADLGFSARFSPGAPHICTVHGPCEPNRALIDFSLIESRQFIKSESQLSVK